MSSNYLTTYGTITTNPTIPAPTATRPWRDLLNPSQFSIPDTYPSALARTRYNLSHFKLNYTITILTILFLTLVYHPLSMILFIALSFLWRFCYFSQVGQGKVVILTKLVDERLVLYALWVVTVVGLGLMGVGVNVLVGLCVGVVLVGLHALFRGNEGDDLV